MSLDASPDVSTREAALAFLLGRIDYERMTSIPYGAQDFKLDRMRALLARLGNPQDAQPIVHVAGTKGKGSTSAMIAAILTTAGYKTGLYTSPHLTRIEERLMIDGQECPSQAFVDALSIVVPIVLEIDAEATSAEGNNRPTYFEILTATALVYFASAKADVAVLEVGLGGRLDSTNVCNPAVTAITSISFDHVKQLGGTLVLIAAEKAGIIKPHVPLVSGVTNDEPREVIRRMAREQHAPIDELERDFGFRYGGARLDEHGTVIRPAEMDYWTRGAPPSAELQGIKLSLFGRHQAANAAIAIRACEHLRRQGWNISDALIRSALQTVRWPGRMEIVRREPTVIVDAAHNVASISALLDTLRESFAGRRRRLIFATTRDKDLLGMLQLIIPEFDEIVFTRYLNNPRAVPPVELAELASCRRNQACSVAENPADAWALISRSAAPEDLVVITGSSFIAGELRAILQS